MTTTDPLNAKTNRKILQLTDLKTESSFLADQFDSFWRSL